MSIIRLGRVKVKFISVREVAVINTDHTVKHRLCCDNNVVKLNMLNLSCKS